MGATLAGGGVNPATGKRVVSAGTCRRVLAVMATAGLYEHSGHGLFDVGLPGKSGVSGSIVTVAPGKGALANVLAAAGRGGQQRARAARHTLPVRTARAEPVRVRAGRARRRLGRTLLTQFVSLPEGVCGSKVSIHLLDRRSLPRAIDVVRMMPKCAL
jgi:hypothetical protein